MASKKICVKQYANEIERKQTFEYQSLRKKHQHVGSRKVQNTRSFENLYSEGQRSSMTSSSGQTFLRATNSGRERQGLLLSSQPISASRSYDDLYSKGQRANKLGHGSSHSIDSGGEDQPQRSVWPVRTRHLKPCDALLQHGQRSQRNFSYGQRSEMNSDEQEHKEKSSHSVSTSLRHNKSCNSEQERVNPVARHHRSCDEMVSKGQRLPTKDDHMAVSEEKLYQNRLKPPKAYSSPSLKPCRSYEDMYSKDGSQKTSDSPSLKPFRSFQDMYSKDGSRERHDNPSQIKLFRSFQDIHWKDGSQERDDSPSQIKPFRSFQDIHSKDGIQKSSDHLTAIGKIVRDNLYPLRVARLKPPEDNGRIRQYRSCEDIRKGDRVLVYPRLINKLSEAGDGKKPSGSSSSKSNSEGALSNQGTDSSYGSLEDHLQSKSKFLDLHDEIGRQIRKHSKGTVLENVSSSMPELRQVESNASETWLVPSKDDMRMGEYDSTNSEPVSLDNLMEDSVISQGQEDKPSGLQGTSLDNQKVESHIEESSEKNELKSRNDSSSGQENVSSPNEKADRGTVPLEEDLKQVTTVTSKPPRKLTIITIEHAQTEDLDNGDCITNYMNDAGGGNLCKDGDSSPR